MSTVPEPPGVVVVAARAITKSDNRLAGSKLDSFYGAQRILHDYDPFYEMILV